jgi:hypothetical protein
MKEILELTPEEGRRIIWSDTDEFKTINTEIVDTGRWSIHKEAIVQRFSDGKFFKTGFSVGATESQEERPFEYDSKAFFIEVVPVEKTIIVYE